MSTLATAARALLDAITHDDSGTAGRGGHGGLISRETIGKADTLRLALAAGETADADAYDRGRRDMLNAILALNPAVAAKVARFAEREPDPEGRLPFDVVLWVTEVATQLGIEPREDGAADA